MVPVVKLQSLAAMEIIAGGGARDDHKSPQADINGNTSSKIIRV
jgi:hypothetical protein